MAFLRAYRKYSQRWRYYPFTHNGVHVFLRPAEGVRFRPCIDGRAAKLVFISKEHGEGRWLSVQRFCPLPSSLPADYGPPIEISSK